VFDTGHRVVAGRDVAAAVVVVVVVVVVLVLVVGVADTWR